MAATAKTADRMRDRLARRSGMGYSILNALIVILLAFAKGRSTSEPLQPG
jgi:hypothetical protein